MLNSYKKLLFSRNDDVFITVKFTPSLPNTISTLEDFSNHLGIDFIDMKKTALGQGLKVKFQIRKVIADLTTVIQWQHKYITTDLDLSCFKNLNEFHFNGNDLSDLDISKNLNLLKVIVTNNSLTETSKIDIITKLDQNGLIKGRLYIDSPIPTQALPFWTNLGNKGWELMAI